HEAQEEAVEATVRLLRLELARLGSIRGVPVVGDELFKRNQLGPFDNVVVGPDEPASPAAAGGMDDRLNGLAGDIASEDEHVRLIDPGRVDELPEAHARSMQVADEVDPRLRHVSPSPCQ